METKMEKALKKIHETMSAQRWSGERINWPANDRVQPENGPHQVWNGVINSNSEFKCHQILGKSRHIERSLKP